MNDIKQNHDPNSLAYYAPPGSDARGASIAPRQDDGVSPLRRADEPAPHLRVVETKETRAGDTSDAFSAAVAAAMRQQMEAEELNASMLQRGKSGSSLATFAIAIIGAAATALTYVVLFPQAQSTFEEHGWAPARLFTAAPRRPAPTLVVRNQSGAINEPLELGVAIDKAEPGSTVTVKGLPIGTRLTSGTQTSLGEWRVPAEAATDVVVTPPADFAGEVKLLAELRGADGTVLVSAVVQLGWKAPPPPPAPIVAASAPEPAAPSAAAPPEPAAAAPAPVEVARDLTANEVGSLIRRAQEMLATGDVKGARVLLLRAADAHDPRAAYVLAKTYDPILSRQSGAADAGPDLAQSRTWYQRAREWGAPEAQRQLDALATTYGR
ncbi:conserved hypothetical protein [Bradyrhizobium sp. STM 3843]|uniref:hypothetical protein n=1 Tax=Bradyrhizobium sp. STM 3843 TaxID=551947 RepID=UPI000240501C|nr:hypothetical protein [Bradyrhizobium sp. STM 3843]CCE10555.1 conserved hypothetical protein [Bradyrhizobium sp. STM 3843]